MPPLRVPHLLPLGLLCASLMAQEPAPRPAGTTTEEKTDASTERREEKSCCQHLHAFQHVHFGAYLQGAMPLRDLKEELDRRTGFGLGVQWTRDHGDWHASRTRLEWNTFPEGGSVAGTRTYAKNYTLSFDHLFKLNQGGSQGYLVAGLGGSRWYLERDAAGLRDATWTTKLAISGGVGIQIAERMDLEARYVASSIHGTFDANALQLSLGWSF